jgi:membrane protein insertase Oxa1/YidC/SpoIIIJ
MATQSANLIEGTWEEVSRHAQEFGGRRLRVMILPDTEPTSMSQEKHSTTGKYARRMQPLLEEIAKIVPSESDKMLAEKELQDFMTTLNENRRRDGAEPIF